VQEEVENRIKREQERLAARKVIEDN